MNKSDTDRSASDDMLSRAPTYAPNYALRELTATPGGRIYPLDRSLIIGRDPKCHIVLESPYVSWRHAALRLTVQGVAIEDLVSRNGVFINDRRVQNDVLRIGDEIRLGASHFLVCLLPGDSGYSKPANKAPADSGRSEFPIRKYLDWRFIVLMAVIEVLLIMAVLFTR